MCGQGRDELFIALSGIFLSLSDFGAVWTKRPNALWITYKIRQNLAGKIRQNLAGWPTIFSGAS